MNAIIFDFRDTLLDVRQSNQKSSELLLEELKIKQSDAINKAIVAVKLKYNKNKKIHDWKKYILLELLNSQNLFLSEEKFEKLLDKQQNVFIKYAKLFPDARKILEYCKKKKIKTGLVIDGTIKREKSILRKLKLNDYFDVIVISEEVGLNKFTSKPLITAIKKLKIAPEKCIVVGDRIDKDIIHANKIGCVSARLIRKKGRYSKIKYNNLDEKPDFEIDNLLKLKKIIF